MRNLTQAYTRTLTGTLTHTLNTNPDPSPNANYIDLLSDFLARTREELHENGYRAVFHDLRGRHRAFSTTEQERSLQRWNL